MANRNTQLLNASCDKDVETALHILRAGGLVAVPTETVYGLAADAMNAAAVQGIFAAKGRPADHPLIVHIGSVAQLEDWASNIPDIAYQLAAAFWPGPLTLILDKAAEVPSAVTGGKSSVGVRVPAHRVLRELLQTARMGVAAPSANPYKRLSPTSAQQVYSQLAGRIDAVLDGGPCAVGLESTILDLTGAQLQVLREGPITARQIAALTGRAVLTPLQHDVAVPGNVAVHYQPHTPLYIASRRQILAALQERGSAIACVFYADTAGLTPTSIVRSLPERKASYAQQLYSTLHALDGMGVEAIWLERPPSAEGWGDVNDRLRRAGNAL